MHLHKKMVRRQKASDSSDSSDVELDTTLTSFYVENTEDINQIDDFCKIVKNEGPQVAPKTASRSSRFNLSWKGRSWFTFKQPWLLTAFLLLASSFLLMLFLSFVIRLGPFSRVAITPPEKKASFLYEPLLTSIQVPSQPSILPLKEAIQKANSETLCGFCIGTISFKLFAFEFVPIFICYFYFYFKFVLAQGLRILLLFA
jgi:hypothetical protein